VKRMGILERVERIHRAHGNVPTYCKRCDLIETMKFYDEDGMSLPKGSFTTKCGCGVFVYRFHNIMKEPDPNNKTSYFTKAFSPSPGFARIAYPFGAGYDPNYKNKDWLERNGFRKTPNGKYSK
jgi:hypothetical protein